MSRFDDFAHLIHPTPEEFLKFASDVEAQLWEAEGPGRLEQAKIMFILLDPATEKPFLPVWLPYTEEEVTRVTGRSVTQGKGRVGLFAATMGYNMCAMPAHKVAESGAGWHRPGQKLVATVWLADTVRVPTSVVEQIAGVQDLEEDVPEEHQTFWRDTMVCDGRGNFALISRPASGEGELLTVTARCVPDLEKPIRYREMGEGIGANSAIPWALAAMALGYRRVFEGEPLP